MSETKARFTVNEVIAFNLAKARRRAGWTQEETAEKLTAATGRRWTKGTLGAAERSWESGRVREFDGNELVAFCRVFGQPLAYFFVPPEVAGEDGEYLLGAAPGEVGPPERISDLDLLSVVLALTSTSEFIDHVNAALNRHNLSWAPARPSWYRPEESAAAEQEETSAVGMPSAGAVVDEARRRRVLQLLEEIRRLMAPEEYPPF